MSEREKVAKELQRGHNEAGGADLPLKAFFQDAEALLALLNQRPEPAAPIHDLDEDGFCGRCGQEPGRCELMGARTVSRKKTLGPEDPAKYL